MRPAKDAWFDEMTVYHKEYRMIRENQEGVDS
jgi:hypothetical protein